MADPYSSAGHPNLPVVDTTPEREIVSWSMRVASEWAGRALIVGLALYALLRLVERLYILSAAVVLALFLTSVLHPVSSRLRDRGLKPSFAAAIVLLGGVLVFGLAGWFVGYQISTHASALGDQIVQVSDEIGNWLRTGPLHLQQRDLDQTITNLQKAIKDHQGQLVSGAVSTAQTALEVLGALLLALLTTFFLLRDGQQIWGWLVGLFPEPAQRRVDAAGNYGWHTLGGYVRGLVTIAFIHATTITMVLLVLRVPLAGALGVLIFLGSFVPLLGLTISGTICVAITLLEHGPAAAVVVAIVIILLLQVEGHLLQPLIMSRAVEVHPLAVALTVTAGTILGGIGGAVIAVPFAAFANSFIKSLKVPIAVVQQAENADQDVSDVVSTQPAPTHHEGDTDAASTRSQPDQ